MIVLPREPVVCSSSCNSVDSNSSTSASTSQAAISSSLAPTKHNSQTPTASEHWRAKGAAGDGTGGVQVASAGFRIKRRTGLVVRETGEPLLGFLAFGQNAGRRIAREGGRETRDRLAGSLANVGGALRVARFEFGQAAAQPASIELADRKWPDTALRAAHPAHQPRSALPRSFSQSGIHDLDESTVAGIEPHFLQDSAHRITDGSNRVRDSCNVRPF